MAAELRAKVIREIGPGVSEVELLNEPGVLWIARRRNMPSGQILVGLERCAPVEPCGG